MKPYKLLLPLILLPNYLLSQQLTPTVLSSAGDVQTNGNVSLSWTLGEVATETYDNGNIILTQGFQQPFQLLIQGLNLDLLVFLEGPYNGSTMNSDLQSKNLIPLSQPYNTAPWNYSGSESIAVVPADVVDWVLVEIRDAASATAALPSTIVETQAALLLSNGSVVATDGSSALQFSANITQQPFIVVWHRNHLGVLSAGPATATGDVYQYDFSTAASQAYGTNAQKLIGGGLYGLYAGDANGDGNINSVDQLLFWNPQSGTTGYLQADYNLDGEVQNQDKDDFWYQNKGEAGQVPE